MSEQLEKARKILEPVLCQENCPPSTNEDICNRADCSGCWFDWLINQPLLYGLSLKQLAEMSEGEEALTDEERTQTYAKAIAKSESVSISIAEKQLLKSRLHAAKREQPEPLDRPDKAGYWWVKGNTNNGGQYKSIVEVFLLNPTMPESMHVSWYGATAIELNAYIKLNPNSKWYYIPDRE